MTLTNHNSKHAYYKKLAALTLAVTLHSLLLLGQSKSKKRDLAFTVIAETNLKAPSSSKANFTYLTQELPINTSAFEYASCIYQNELIVVSKRKVGSIAKSKSTIVDQSDYKLIAFAQDQNNWSQGHLFEDAFMGKENHGGITFSKDETRVYFTKTSLENPQVYQLYTADKKNKFANNWQNEKALILANKKYSIEHPWISQSGKFLYFSSNMPGGYGGYDIYVSEIHKNGSLGKPINLGDNVNSLYDENYPTLNNSGTQVYFASNRTTGFGGFDLYSSYTSSGDYSKSVNLGPSINSKYDEVGYITTSDTTGYFSSNKNALSRNQNIYSFTLQH